MLHIVYFEILLHSVLRSDGKMYWWTFLIGIFLLLFPTNYIYCSYKSLIPYNHTKATPETQNL